MMIEFLKNMFTKPTVMWNILEELVFIVLFFAILIIGAIIVYLVSVVIIKIKERRK